MTEEKEYDKAFADMAAEPLEMYEAQPEKPTSIRLSSATRRQIRWLESQGYGNQSKIIALAVQALWSQEQSAAGR